MTITVQVPGVVGVEVEVGDDIGVAGQQGGLAVEEVDHELLVGRVEPETGGHVEAVIPHFRALGKARRREKSSTEFVTSLYVFG